MILVTLLTPQNWTLVKYDSPIDPDFAELGATEALFPPYSTPLTAYMGVSLAQVAWSKVPSRSWVFRLDPSRPMIGCRQAGTTCVPMPLVNQLRAGVIASRKRVLTTDASVARNFSHLRNLSRIMASKVGYRVVLFMRPSDDATAPEPEKHRNSNHDIMDKVELIHIQLHGMDSSEVMSVKEVLVRTAQWF